MPTTLTELIASFETLWPLSGAEEWDRPGLTVGQKTKDINKVLLSVDVTAEVIAEARLLGCELIVSHHPLLLKGVNYLAEDQLKGELVSMAVINSIAIYSAHTNADIVFGGVSDVLAKAIGLIDAKALVETAAGVGHGRIGRLDQPLTLEDFARRVSSILPKSNAPVRVAGDRSKQIETVAVVGGAGDSFISDAQAKGADCLVTSDLRHHVSLDAVSDPSKPLALIDISHFAAESVWLAPTAKALAKLHPNTEFLVSEVVTDPWTMTILEKSNHES
jgi:dinuclear metal center YbgI/SA1388 family protein